MTIAMANGMIHDQHRHNDATRRGVKLAVGLACEDRVVGVALLSVPTAPEQMDGLTLEVKRVCVADGHPNANSMLYGAMWRATEALGYHRLLTYTLANESGSSLRAVSFRPSGEVAASKPDDWTGRPNRVRPFGQTRRPPSDAVKIRWERSTPLYARLIEHPLRGELPRFDDESPSLEEEW